MPMLEAYARSHYQKLLVDPLAAFLTRWFPVSPHYWTLLGGVLGLCLIPLLITQHAWLAVTALIASGYFDTIDGTVARMMNRNSAHGSVLDILTDRIVEFCAIF